jgi:hypothetical protein
MSVDFYAWARTRAFHHVRPARPADHVDQEVTRHV